MASRRQSREQALQILYQADVRKEYSDSLMVNFLRDSHREENLFTEILVEGVFSRLKEIDQEIEKNSENWKLYRMAKVDLALLRMGVFEILFLDEIPPSVTMNEIIEIAKKFGSEESAAFVNGILDKISKKS